MKEKLFSAVCMQACIWTGGALFIILVRVFHLLEVWEILSAYYTPRQCILSC